MGSVRNIVLFVVCFNLMLMLGGFQLVQFVDGQDMVSYFADVDDDYNIGMGDNLENQTDQLNPAGGTGTGSIGGGFFSFFNVIAMLWNFILFLLNITFAPVAMFMTIPNIPSVITMLIGIPLMVMYILGIIWFIRGSQD